MNHRDVMAGWPDWKRKIGEQILREYKRATAPETPNKEAI